MKFSELEKGVIRDLCAWAGKANANVFIPTRDFFSEKALKEGVGLFFFSKEEDGRPPIILCIDIDKFAAEKYPDVHNNVLFLLYFLRKLEQLGLVTISEGRYSKDKEYAVATFKDVAITGIRRITGKEWGYSFIYVKKGNEGFRAVLVQNGLTIKRQDDDVALLYHTEEVFSRFDAFSLVSSNISLEQDLFDLVEKDFKTNEELMLENASQQLETAKHILNEAKEQTTKAVESINQSKEQFTAAQKKSEEQFVAAQEKAASHFGGLYNQSKEQFEAAQRKAEEQFAAAQDESARQFVTTTAASERQFRESLEESKKQFKSANCKSILALFFAVVSIIASPIVATCVRTTIDKEQYDHLDSVQTEISNKLDEINLNVVNIKPSIETDSNHTNVIDKLDEISSTLKKVNSKMDRLKPALPK